MSTVARCIIHGTLLLGMAASSWAAPHPVPDPDSEVGPKDIAHKAAPLTSLKSIPYPTGALYIAKGITGAFLGGKSRNYGDDQSLYQWQGELGYFYTPYFSAGLGYKINAGEPSDQEQKILNRYYLNARFHATWKQLAVFAGPQLGVDNLNILAGTSAKVDSVIPQSIDDTKAGLGLEVGAGWKFSRWAGLTMGCLSEYSLAGQNGSNLNIRLLPGVAIDMLGFSHSMRELVPAFYINLEFQVGFLLLEDLGSKHDQAAMAGVSIAF